jgi:putative phosphoesterase
MTRIGILSDTHLTLVSEELRRTMTTLFRHVDMVLHAGDITSIGVYEFLSNWNLIAVRGNMDDYEVRALLPEKRVEEIGGKRIGIMHGRGSSHGLEDLVRGEFRDVDLVVFGHSHAPLNVMKEDTLLFNPGSFRGTPSLPGTVGILEIDRTIRLAHLEVE